MSVKETIKKYYVLLLAVAGCMGVFGCSAGVTCAFLQKSTEDLHNTITPGSIDVLLTEPLWRKEEGENTVPGQTVSKNPIAWNTGENDSWIFLEVEVPVKTIRLVDPETGKKTPETETELLSFKAENSWQLVDRVKEMDKIRYVYGYKEIVKAGNSTDPLFHGVTAVNYLEGELDPDEILKMPVKALSVQSGVEPAEEGLAAIYQRYLSQE